jgi:hypothetical protein
VLAVAGCASTNEPADPRQAEYEALVGQAVAELDKANATGFEWRDSRKFLKQADEAAKAGDYDKAMKLADKARAQGIAAQQQAQSQANAGPHF